MLVSFLFLFVRPILLHFPPSSLNTFFILFQAEMIARNPLVESANEIDENPFLYAHDFAY